MPFRFSVAVMSVLAMLALTSCLPKATPSSDAMASAVAEVAFGLLTETAAAAPPTDVPPTPTITPSPQPTSTVEVRFPVTVNLASCGLGGPFPTYADEVNLPKGKTIDLLGRGTIDGYLIIRDPHFQRPCWIKMTDLQIFPGIDWSQYPLMTPGVPTGGE